MKRLMTYALFMALPLTASYAKQAKKTTAAEHKAEQAVEITSGPTVENVTANSATVKWATDKVAANRVRYRASGGEWKDAHGGAGSKEHSVQLSGLKPGTKYEYEILTTSGAARKTGEFETTGSSAAAGGVSAAQQEKAENAVKITSGPTITNIKGTSATIKWTTNNVAANEVKYRSGSGAFKNAYERKGSKEHSLNLTGLKPNETVDYQILTRDGEVRKSGSFKTAATANGTAPDVTQ